MDAAKEDQSQAPDLEALSARLAELNRGDLTLPPPVQETLAEAERTLARLLSDTRAAAAAIRLFPVQTSTLPGPALAEMLEREYGLSGPLSCRFQGKELNDTYRVSSPAETNYLRVYRRGWRERGDIEAEIAILRALEDAGVSATVPRPRRDGGYITPLRCQEGERYAVLFAGLEGEHSRNPSEDECFLLGKTVGRMHNVTDKLGGELYRPHFDSYFFSRLALVRLEPYLSHRAEDYEYLAYVTYALGARIDALPESPGYYGICHADLHYKNVLYGGGEARLLDFDLCGYGPRAFDLASFVWGRVSLQGEDVETMARRFEPFLSGYREERAGFVDQLQDTAALVVLREIWALSLEAQGPEDWGYRALNDRLWDDSIAFIRDWISCHGLL